MAKTLKARPINSEGINYDSDQAILDKTVVKGGKWCFYEGEKLIAEAEAPAEMTWQVIEQWGASIRARTKRELDQTDTDKRIASRREKTEADHGSRVLGADGQPLGGNNNHSSIDVEPLVEAGGVQATDDDPYAFINEKITISVAKLKAISVKRKEVQEIFDSLEEEEEQLLAEQAKWQKMREVLDGED